MNRIIGFDVARALAIGLVVLSHVYQGAHAVGIYGVELFFALSGFLIGTILYRCVPASGHWPLGGVVNFWQRRWWRTLPNYYLFLLISIAFHHGRGEWPENGAVGLLPFLVFAQDLMSPNSDFFGVSWSLCVEEGFYLVFPLLLLLSHRALGSRLGAFVISGLAFLLISVSLREVAFVSHPAAEARFMTLPRLDAIGYGVALAVLNQEVSLTDKTRRRLAGLGALLLAGVIVLHSRQVSDDPRGFYRLALIAMPLSFALAMPLMATWERLPLSLGRLESPVTAVSQWSYSIYLCHFPILMGLYPLFGSLRDHPLVNLASKVLGIALTLLVSRFIFRHFESRFTAMRPREIHASAPAIAPAPVTAAPVVPGELKTASPPRGE